MMAQNTPSYRSCSSALPPLALLQMRCSSCLLDSSSLPPSLIGTMWSISASEMSSVAFPHRLHRCLCLAYSSSFKPLRLGLRAAGSLPANTNPDCQIPQLMHNHDWFGLTATSWMNV
jgi:hypothetical protein